MSTIAIQPTETTEAIPATAKPAALYFATLHSETSRSGQAPALNAIARLAGSENCAALDWTALTPEAAGLFVHGYNVHLRP